MRRVQELVLSNVYVTDLQFYSEGDIDAITFHYQIGRDAEGRITEVLENGMRCGGDFTLPIVKHADFPSWCRDEDSLSLGCVPLTRMWCRLPSQG